MRRISIVLLIACVAAGMLLAPAEAKKKGKKKRKPVTFTAEGSFVLGNPADLMGAGITRNEFIETCAIPATQGGDGYIVEVTGPITKVMSNVVVSGTGSIEPDLDMYLYSEDCSPMGEYSTEQASEVGVMPEGTKYVAVTAFFGAEISFTLKATEIR